MCYARFARGSALESASTKNNRYRKKIGCAPVAALPDLHGNQFLRNGESVFSCTIFHAERDFADFFFTDFSAVEMCSQKNNVFVKNSLVRQRRFLANSKAFFSCRAFFFRKIKFPSLYAFFVRGKCFKSAKNCRNIERIFFSCFFVHG